MNDIETLLQHVDSDAAAVVVGPCPWPTPDQPNRVATTCPLGPALCLHAWAVSAAAARVYVQFGGARPMPDVPDRLRDLLQRRLAPRDLLAAGVTPALLAVCDVTAADLADMYGPDTESLLEGLELDWPSLLLLRWTPELLRDRVAWPVIALVEGPCKLTIWRLLSRWPLTFRWLASILPLRDIAVLGATIWTLRTAMGLTPSDFCRAAAHSLNARHRDAAIRCLVPGGLPAWRKFCAVDEPNVKDDDVVVAALSSLQ